MKYLMNTTQSKGAFLWLILLVLMCATGKSYGSTTDSYELGFINDNTFLSTEYEAEHGILSEGATIQDCGSCSNNKQVGNLGGSPDNYFTYDLDILVAGDYRMDLSFSSGDPRSIFIQVNNKAPVEVVCDSGDWSTVGSISLALSFDQGSNTIKFFNDHNYGPNIDKFTLEYIDVNQLVYQAEDGELYNGASIQNCEDCSNNSQVGDLGGGSQGYFTYDLHLDQGGLYTMKLYFSSADPRSIFISANDNQAIGVLCESGGWTTVAEKQITIELKEGLNSIKFFNDTGYGPNIDGFTLAYIPDNEGECEDCETISFGSSGTIEYNTLTGTFNVFQNNQLIIHKAYSELIANNSSLSSKDYSLRTLTSSSYSDPTGSGRRIAVELTSNTLPTMRQVFYVYDNMPYFLMEVFLESDLQLESNYMAPIVSAEVGFDQPGDYHILEVPFDNDAWVRYTANSTQRNVSAISSEVTAFYDNTSRLGLISGSVEHGVWKTGIETSGISNTLNQFRVFGGYASASGTRDQSPHGSIQGRSLKSPKIFVGIFSDWRKGMESYGVANKINDGRYIADWAEGAPFGWNSWGSIQSDINLEKSKLVVEYFADELPFFRNNETAYIDLDSYWDNMVQGGLEGDFTALKEFVDYCKSHHLKPGIYWAPFVDWGKFDRRVEGSSYNYASSWTTVEGGYHDVDGARAMDPTHPATKQRINLVIDKFKQTGFEMIKIDFIGHAAAEATSYYDPSITTGMQAFAHGMEYLIDRIGNQMLVYAAISPNLATGRYVHMRRIACDAYADINATEYTLNSTTYGWWQSRIYDFIDADHIVFGNSSLGENRARLTSAVVNGSIIMGDDYSSQGQWMERSKSLLQNKDILKLAARTEGVFVPVEGNTNQTASESYVLDLDGTYYVALFNYGNSKSYQISLDRLGIPQGAYCIKELYSGEMFSINGASLKLELGEKDAAIYEFKPGEEACVFSLPDNYEILSKDVSCFQGADGEIAIKLKNPDYTYAVAITGQVEPIQLPENSGEYKFTSLTAGVYTLCFTIEEQPDYSQCFDITIGEPGGLEVVSTFDKATTTVRLDLKGAKRYYVELNGEEQVLDTGIHNLELIEGENELYVRGDLECQGSYTEKIIVTSSLTAFPNPTKDFIYINLKQGSGNLDVGIYDLMGRMVKQTQLPVKNKKAIVNLSELEGGIYAIHLHNDRVDETIKVIKQ